MNTTNRCAPSLAIIVGAGPIGLALALELGTRSVPCLIIERDERRGYAPRAKTTNIRTRELMRRWGVAEDLAKASPFGIDFPSDIKFVTRMNGHEIESFENALFCSPKRDPRYCEHSQWIPQYKVEQVLLAKVQQLPSVEVRYGVEFIDFEQDEDVVKVRVLTTATGEEQIIDASYLVGADGARSTVRDKIGAQMIGTYGLSRNYNIIFRAPGLAEQISHGQGIIYWLLNADAPATMGPMDEGDLWFFVPTALESDMSLTDEEAVALIKQSTGIDLPYEILSSDVWIASRLLADKYRDGRVFLAGDACHLHPPWGGYGMNMGVADAVDLGWKIAATLQGWGGAALLDSYESERRPVHEMVLDESEGNHMVLPNQLVLDGMEENSPHGEAVRKEIASLIRKTKMQEFYSLGVILGFRYRGSPVIFDDGTEDEYVLSREYVPSAAPGSLSPHAWIGDASIYDTFGKGFTLLVFADPSAEDIERAVKEAEVTGIPLKVVTLCDPELASLYAASRALVRPDQVIAWRGNIWPATGLLDFAAGLETALNTP